MDPVQQQIEELILAADDPKDKAFLLIMNRIAASLDNNTFLTQELSDDFKSHTEAFTAHETKEMELINQGKGGIKVTIYLMGILQVVVAFLLNGTLNDMKTTKNSVIEIERRVAVHEEYHRRNSNVNKLE